MSCVPFLPRPLFTASFYRLFTRLYHDKSVPSRESMRKGQTTMKYMILKIVEDRRGGVSAGAFWLIGWLA